MNVASKIILTLLILLALGWLTKISVSDFLRLRPGAYMDAINSGMVQLDPVKFDQARDQLNLAHRWDKSNPVVLEYMSQIDLRLAQMLWFNPGLQEKYLRSALVNLDVALLLRPYSAYLWAAKMTAISWLMQHDKTVDRIQFAAMALALHRAAMLDPWDPSVLQQIMSAGTLHYKDFSTDDRSVVDAAVTRARYLHIKI